MPLARRVPEMPQQDDPAVMDGEDGRPGVAAGMQSPEVTAGPAVRERDRIP